LMRPENMGTYSWIERDKIKLVEKLIPYIRITYKDGESFLIDWTEERFRILKGSN
jgi:hypothetical protein